MPVTSGRALRCLGSAAPRRLTGRKALLFRDGSRLSESDSPTALGAPGDGPRTAVLPPRFLRRQRGGGGPGRHAARLSTCRARSGGRRQVSGRLLAAGPLCDPEGPAGGGQRRGGVPGRTQGAELRGGCYALWGGKLGLLRLRNKGMGGGGRGGNTDLHGDPERKYWKSGYTWR